MRLGTFATTLLLFALTLRYTAFIFMNKWVWAAGTVITSLIMTSGYMFTRIRGMPYSGHDGQWIAQGHQNQFGQEVHVVAAICKFIPIFDLLNINKFL